MTWREMIKTARQHPFMPMSSGLLLLLLHGCVIDVNLDPLRDPGPLEDPPVDDTIDQTDQIDQPDVDFFDPIIDDQVQPDQSDCDYACEAGWTPLCYGADNWCISSYRGVGTCCQALSTCLGLGAFPGIWTNAGSRDVLLPLPGDFFGNMSLPGLVIVWSGEDPPGSGSYKVNISCMNSSGIKVDGEIHELVDISSCTSATCSPWTHPLDPDCNTSNIGCGTACTMPYWCWKP